ncbi:hypothetical protein P344_04095 [Spiroplasma mirum ATCC 29335]|uniref:Uncharacterized protein n=2 Tax=Spiroplasma mirum TaxID=2144 RepID=W0GLS3_9MOLU|nr:MULTISPECIES: hypothetical protein [Spiroplasma]AHF61102.1 hypothetical protein SMM_0684 [Spiroplasma mirum ATCC 29335]AHI58147.1 hypothetical protein P344_04095 [Spiroplasma mirum ATCC 29335]AKM53199.1 hypothetical protein SATRI_v1c07470 [Spiroplasma atrichopogonis]
MLKVSENNILFINASGHIYQLNNQGVIQNDSSYTSFRIFALWKLQDDTILAAHGETVLNNLGELYQLNDDESVKLKVDQPLTKNFTDQVSVLIQVNKGDIFAFGDKIYKLSNH